MNWRTALEEVRHILKEQQTSHQFRVAELAMKVCKIQHGGNPTHSNTLVNFAKELDMNPKLLYRWVEVKRNVYDKLDEGMRGIVSYNMCHQIARRVNSKATKEKIQELSLQMLDLDKDNMAIVKYASRIRSLAYRLNHTDSVKRTSKPVLEEVLYFMKSAEDAIRKVYPNLKPKENLISSRYQVNSSELGVEKTLIGKFTTPDGKIITLKEKDDKIYKYLYEKDAPVGPTEIGMKVGGYKRDAASAWAGRSLDKLLKFDLVEVNKQGLYKVKRDVLDRQYQ